MSLIEFITHYWLEVLFGAALSLLGLAYRTLSSRFKQYMKEQDAVKLGIQALLRDRIIQTYNHYSAKGYCPIYGMENAEAMYTQYHALGGNGAITKLLEVLRELPTEPKEEE